MPESPSSAPRHVFVYGTLRRGEANDINLLSPPPRYVGQARIEGVMHHLGAYPGVRLQSGAPVTGEVYAISPELERRLDEIEMILPVPTGEYLKRELVVQVDHGADRANRADHSDRANRADHADRADRADSPRGLLCIVYEISPLHAAGQPVIASGDWVANKDA